MIKQGSNYCRGCYFFDVVRSIDSEFSDLGSLCRRLVSVQNLIAPDCWDTESRNAMCVIVNAMTRLAAREECPGFLDAVIASRSGFQIHRLEKVISESERGYFLKTLIEEDERE